MMLSLLRDWPMVANGGRRPFLGYGEDEPAVPTRCEGLSEPVQRSYRAAADFELKVGLFVLACSLNFVF